MKVELIPPSVKDGFKRLLQPIVRILVRYRLNPNHFTTFSLAISVISAIAFGRGNLRWGGILLLLGGLFDMIDGAVARSSNRVTRFGALYDSTLDRYAEIIVFFGIGFYFVSNNDPITKTGLWISMAVFIGIAGSVMVSYVRARAEGLGFDCKVGVMQRPERIVLVSLGAMISEIALVIAMILVAALSNFTALQRIYYIWRAENEHKWKKLPSNVDHE